MAENIIVTRQVAAVIGGETMPEPTASATYPAMRFHPTLPPVTVQNEAEEQALPAGYRAKVWSEAEIAAQTTPPVRPVPSAEDAPGDDPPRPRSHR